MNKIHRGLTHKFILNKKNQNKFQIMKKPTKIIMNLLNLFVLFMLFGCDKDLYEEPIHQSKINVEKVSLKDSKSSFKIHPNLLKAVSKIRSVNNSEIGKIVYDSINNIYFDDELGIKITNEDYESYTFKIIKEGGKLENILFTKNEYNEFDVFKLNYDITEVELILLNFQDIKPKEVINLMSSVTANKFIVITFLVSLCNHDPYDCGGFFCGFEEVTFSMWIDDSIGMGSNGGGGGSSEGGSNSGGGGGGSGGGSSANNPNSNTNSIELPILTMPVHGAPIVISPCGKVKKAFTKLPTLRTELSGMSGKTGETTEWGRFKTTNASVIQTPGSTASGEVSFPIPSNGQYTMMAHTHNSPANTTYSVFSWADLEALATLVRNEKVDTDNFVAFLATADGTYYAFTIEDPDAFAQFFATALDTGFDPAIGAKRAKEMDKYYDIDKKGTPPLISENSTDNNKVEKAFLDFMQDNNIGASLFESNSTFTTFDKVTHNKTTDNVDKQPCN